MWETFLDLIGHQKLLKKSLRVPLSLKFSALPRNISGQLTFRQKFKEIKYFILIMTSCDICGKDFQFASKLLRHLNRITRCTPNKVSGKNVEKPEKVEEKVNKNQEKVNNFQEKVNTSQEKVNTIQEKVNTNDKKVNKNTKKFSCDECEKSFTSKQSLQYHSNICKGAHSLECPVCFKIFSNKVTKCRHMKRKNCSPPEKDQNKPDLEEEILALKKEISILKSTRGNTTNNVTNNNGTTNNITNYTIKYQVKYNQETKCLTTEDPKAPFPELLCFNGFKLEAARSKLKNIDQEQLQEHIDNVRRNKDYYNLFSFFFRNVDNRRLHMFTMGKNNNATHAHVFNNGSLEKIEKSQLFENVSKYIGQYLLNMSIDNIDVINMVLSDQASKNAFIEVTKDNSQTFDYYKINESDL